MTLCMLGESRSNAYNVSSNTLWSISIARMKKPPKVATSLPMKFREKQEPPSQG